MWRTAFGMVVDGGQPISRSRHTNDNNRRRVGWSIGRVRRERISSPGPRPRRVVGSGGDAVVFANAIVCPNIFTTTLRRFLFGNATRLVYTRMYYNVISCTRVIYAYRTKIYKIHVYAVVSARCAVPAGGEYVTCDCPLCMPPSRDGSHGENRSAAVVYCVLSARIRVNNWEKRFLCARLVVTMMMMMLLLRRLFALVYRLRLCNVSACDGLWFMFSCIRAREKSGPRKVNKKTKTIGKKKNNITHKKSKTKRKEKEKSPGRYGCRLFNGVGGAHGIFFRVKSTFTRYL